MGAPTQISCELACCHCICQQFEGDLFKEYRQIENEFALDQFDEMEDDAPRIGRMNDLMQGLAQQASLDPGDDLGM